MRLLLRVKHFHSTEDTRVHPTALIGSPPEMRDHDPRSYHHGVYVNREARIGAYCTVDGGYEKPTFIGDCWLMKGVHVGHDAIIRDGCEVAPHTSIGGYVELGKNVKVGQMAVFKPKVKIGDGAVIGAGAVVTKDVPAGETWVGNPARRLIKHDRVPEVDRGMWEHAYGR